MLFDHFDLELHQMNMKTLVLNEDLDEEVYMEQLEYFSSGGEEHLVWKLKKFIYGLQTSFHNVMSFFGFIENIMDQFYILEGHRTKICFFILYVNDSLLARIDECFLYVVKKFLCNSFDMKGVDHTYYLCLKK